MEAEFGKIGFCRNGPKVSFFNEFFNFLSTLSVSSLVLLIDDSDGPLISSLGDKALFKSVQRKLNEFYAILKSNDHAMRFLFLTGTTFLNRGPNSAVSTICMIFPWIQPTEDFSDIPMR